MEALRKDVPLAKKNELNGIIYLLKSNFSIDPIINSYVIPSASVSSSSTSSLVYWNVTNYQIRGSSRNLPWVQLSFPNRYIFPSAYSMRGVFQVNNRFSHAKSWNVYGIHEGAENNEEKWDLLATNNTSESTYCNLVDEDGYCEDNRTGTFTLKPLPSSRGYRSLRWKYKTGSPSTNYYFSTSGLDVYGILSSSQVLSLSKKGKTCIRRYSSRSFIFTLLFSNIISE